MIALIIGGSGSGKSAFAEKLLSALSEEKRVYLATMQVYDGESVRRVERHRAQRADKGFTTIECPMNLASADVERDSAVLLEDLPNLCANELFGGGDPKRMVSALSQLARNSRHLVMVTGDVFSDGELYDAAMQDYLRMLADLNRQAACLADCVVEVVCSIPVVLKGEIPCLSSVR